MIKYQFYLKHNYKLHNDLYINKVSYDLIMLRLRNFVLSLIKLKFTKLAVKSAVNQPKSLEIQLSYIIAIANNEIKVLT